MSFKIINEFHLVDWGIVGEQKGEKLTDEEKYKRLIDWAGQARRQNPGVFDALTAWMLDDSEWTEDKLTENEQILRQGVLARFKEQNAQLREYLKELKPSGVVNEAIFKALDRFDDELSGKPHDENLRETVSMIFSDFSVMQERDVRIKIAGYANYLKDCDTSVQWTLFMPEVVKKHGHKINRESFEYIEIGKLRFIGLECSKVPDVEFIACSSFEPNVMIKELFLLLPEYGTEITAICHFEHHHGGEVNKNQVNMMGYFFKADTPVPEGYAYYDVPTIHTAYAMYHSPDFDGNVFGASYEFTRDQILGDNVCIPYPQAYWTAEVYTEGFFTGSGAFRFGYLFSVEL